MMRSSGLGVAELTARGKQDELCKTTAERQHGLTVPQSEPVNGEASTSCSGWSILSSPSPGTVYACDNPGVLKLSD